MSRHWSNHNVGFLMFTCVKILILDKARAADLYLIYKRELKKASGCKSDTDRMRMFNTLIVLAKCLPGWKFSYSSLSQRNE